MTYRKVLATTCRVLFDAEKTSAVEKGRGCDRSVSSQYRKVLQTRGGGLRFQRPLNLHARPFEQPNFLEIQIRADSQRLEIDLILDELALGHWVLVQVEMHQELMQ
eukprot:SAG31_NODE_1283_length_9011_cov_2.475202_5_plen_106_part_00